jgi:SAM-dependent methyltransferase
VHRYALTAKICHSGRSSEDNTLHPEQRFCGLAESYGRYRPDYPASALDCIITYGRLTPDSLMIDLGAGTGIASRAFAARGLRVIGIEPNEEMRAQALFQGGTDAIDYRTGSAEDRLAIRNRRSGTGRAGLPLVQGREGTRGGLSNSERSRMHRAFVERAR